MSSGDWAPTIHHWKLGQLLSCVRMLTSVWAVEDSKWLFFCLSLFCLKKAALTFALITPEVRLHPFAWQNDALVSGTIMMPSCAIFGHSVWTAVGGWLPCHPTSTKIAPLQFAEKSPAHFSIKSLSKTNPLNYVQGTDKWTETRFQGYTTRLWGTAIALGGERWRAGLPSASSSACSPAYEAFFFNREIGAALTPQRLMANWRNEQQ